MSSLVVFLWFSHMVIEKRMCKAQIMIDHIDVGMPSQSACYQCLAHLGETDKNLKNGHKD